MPDERRRELARLEFQFGTGEGPGQALELDAVLTDQHTSQALVTKHPVEKGARPADHIEKGPESFNLDAIVAEFQPSRSADDQIDGRPGTALDTLLRIQSEGVLVAFRGGRRDLSSLALSNLSWSYTREAGRSLHFTATLEEVRIVETRTVELERRTSTPNGNKAKDRGVAPTEPQDLVSVGWEAGVAAGTIDERIAPVRYVPGRGFLDQGAK